MFRMFRCCALALLMAVFALFPGTARADLQFDLSGVINGATPVGSAPWLTADFHTNAVGNVTLTMENLMPSYEFVDEWMFNVDVDSTALVAAYISGPRGELVRSSTQSLDGGNNMKAGFFNIGFSWPKANSDPNRFAGGSTVVWNFTGAGITEDSFRLTSLPDPRGFETDVTAAHVQGLPDSQSGSFTVAAVPEVSSVYLLLGVAGLMAPALRKKLR